MELQQQIEQAYISAVKSKDSTSLNVLRMLKASLQNKKIESKKDLKEEEIVAVLRSEKKKRKDSIESFEQAKRNDLIEKEKAELQILEKFLPAMMSEDQVRTKIEEVLNNLDETAKTNFGQVMGSVMKELKGKADGSLVTKVVKELLG